MSRRLLDALRAQGSAMRQTMDKGQAVDQLVGARRPAVVALLAAHDAAEKSVGMSVALASVDRQLDSYRRIQKTLLLVGLVSVLLAGALSFILSRRAMAPVRQLAAAAEAARQGNYDVKVDTGRGDEVGKLARSFDVLLSDLREKRDMEQYVAELSRTLPDAGPARESAFDKPGGAQGDAARLRPARLRQPRWRWSRRARLTACRATCGASRAPWAAGGAGWRASSASRALPPSTAKGARSGRSPRRPR
jgi:HAMP domain-containing protein